MAKNKIKKIRNGIWWIVGITGSAVFIFGLIILSDRREQERPGQIFDSQGEQHIAVGSAHPAYNSNPPTSGWHYASPAGWGAYESELPDEQILHNLEHGGVWISYKEIDGAVKSELEKIARTNVKVIVTPRSANDASIAIASWGRLQKLEKFDETAIMKFINANRNKSPEPFAG